MHWVSSTLCIMPIVMVPNFCSHAKYTHSVRVAACFLVLWMNLGEEWVIQKRRGGINLGLMVKANTWLRTSTKQTTMHYSGRLPVYELGFLRLCLKKIAETLQYQWGKHQICSWFTISKLLCHRIHDLLEKCLNDVFYTVVH